MDSPNEVDCNINGGLAGTLSSFNESENFT